MATKEKSYTQEELLINRRKWIDALRSGNYKQGKNKLRSGKNQYCCLGVACDISELGEWGRQRNLNEEEEDYCYIFNEYDRYVLRLHHDALKYLGLEEKRGLLLQDELMKMNDSRECSFEEIADYLEAYNWEMVDEEREER